MGKKIISFFFLCCASFLWPANVFATDPQPHYTVIINQVRGPECCSGGGVNELRKQITSLEKNHLPATFAVRYDALNSPAYTQILEKTDFEIAAFLEITPSLASASGVVYRGPLEKWFVAENAWPIGYKPDDRLKLIDTFMTRFKTVFGFFPKTTVGWMIDPGSLGYLASRYQVTAHELTREQWKTDSYTLWGGPPHYPYSPSSHWALIPAQNDRLSLMILRQTITDPVNNYGDLTNSYTSQPNDYGQRRVGLDYFTYLFNQAHKQLVNPYTIAIVGLENSMADIWQTEFSKQLDYIGNWAKSDNNFVVTTAQLVPKIATSSGTITSYEGTQQNSRAWWITAGTYRARIVFDSGVLYLSDLRIYNDAFADPYEQTPAQGEGYWIVPFLLNNAKFELKKNISSGDAAKYQIQKRGDNLILTDSKGQILLTFSSAWFEIPTKASFSNWGDAWGVKTDPTPMGQRLTPWSDSTRLANEREEKYPLLFPILTGRTVSPEKSFLYVNNQYAVAGRNPVRLVFFPRDKYAYPVASSDPLIITSQPTTNISQNTPDSGNGTTYIDLKTDQPGKFSVKIKSGSASFTQDVYFSPNCKNTPLVCLQNPTYLWWYLHTLFTKIKS